MVGVSEMRAPFQVNVFPFRTNPDGTLEYAVFQRTDDSKVWQGIAGGGEDDETPLEAAIREAWEEAEIPSTFEFIELDAIASVPVDAVSGFLWGPDVLVIPQHHFGVDVRDREIALSAEHIGVEWRDYERAYAKHTFESNRIALWELNHRLIRAAAR